MSMHLEMSKQTNVFEGPVRANQNQRSYRACIWCRSHKRKCDGLEPCSTCSNSPDGRVCAYAAPKKRGRKITRQYDDKLSIEHVVRKRQDEETTNESKTNPIRIIEQPLPVKEEPPNPFPVPSNQFHFLEPSPCKPSAYPPVPSSAFPTSSSPNLPPSPPDELPPPSVLLPTHEQLPLPPNALFEGVTSPGLYSYSSLYNRNSPMSRIDRFRLSAFSSPSERTSYPRNESNEMEESSMAEGESDFPKRSSSMGNDLVFPELPRFSGRFTDDFPTRSFSGPGLIEREWNAHQAMSPSSPMHLLSPPSPGVMTPNHGVSPSFPGALTPSSLGGHSPSYFGGHSPSYHGALTPTSLGPPPGGPPRSPSRMDIHELVVGKKRGIAKLESEFSDIPRRARSDQSISISFWEKRDLHASTNTERRHSHQEFMDMQPTNRLHMHDPLNEKF